MKPYFNLKNIIKRQTNKEAYQSYGFSNTGELRGENKGEVEPLDAGMWKFILDILLALRP